MKVVFTKGALTAEGTFQKGTEAEVSDGLGKSLVESGQAVKAKQHGTGKGTATGSGQQDKGTAGKQPSRSAGYGKRSGRPPKS